LILGPGKAFGSGQHETTISCIEEMERLGSLAGKRVLDVGTGTGILAVAAVLMDACRVVRGYHLVLANIYGDIILKEAVNLAARVEPKGHIILSGIDYTDSTPIRILFRNEGLKERSTMFHEEYVTQVWFNPPSLSSGP
jgi:ribosomal protein L11 methyltransferase